MLCLVFTLQIESASSDEELKDVMMDDIDILADAGCKFPISAAKCDNKMEIIKPLTLYYAFFRVKVEIDQLKDGLKQNSGKLMEFVQDHPAEFEHFFHGCPKPLTAGTHTADFFKGIIPVECL